MENRMKEDERIERIIRSLLRLPENRRCINCNSLGPQYACTTFLTFVCTNCSGVHNIQRLRDFIKHVYVNGKYTEKKSLDKLPRLRLNDKEESYESRKVCAYRGGSRSSGFEDRYEQRYSERSSPGRRSEDGIFKNYYDERSRPRYAQENSRYGGLRRSPVCFEVVDDRFRDDQYGSRRISSTESKTGIRSPDFLKNIDRLHSPRTVGVILGDSVPPLQVGKLSTAIDGKDADGSPHTQKIASSSDQCSIDRSPAEHKRRSSGSLIDLSPDSDPLGAETIPQTRQIPQSDSGGNWTSFQHPAKEKAFQAPSANTLESLLFELSVPSVAPASDMSEGPSNDDTLSTSATGTIPTGMQQMPPLPISVSASTTASTTHYTSAEPFDGGPPQPAPSGNGDNIKIADKQQLSNMQQYHPSASPVTDSSPITQQTNTLVGPSNNQPWISSCLPNRQGPLSAPAEQSSQAVSKSAQDTGSGVGSEPLSVETQSSGRKKLPADLFTATYSTVTAPVAGWQNGSPYGMGFSMQYYPNAMPVPAFPNSARSTNPFDLNDERNQVKAPPFPSMASLQGALQNASAASSLLHTSSLGTQSSGLTAPQSPSNASAMPSHSSSFVSAMPQGAYMGIQVHNNIPPSRSQGLGGFGSDGVFGSLNPTQQSTGKYSAPSTPNPFSSMGGNPFG